MYQKRAKKLVKKGSNRIISRETRRKQRLQIAPAHVKQVKELQCTEPFTDKISQNSVIVELVWKTIALMNKNTCIYQKISALQKETSEFFTTVLSDPNNNKVCQEDLRLHGPAPPTQLRPKDKQS